MNWADESILSCRVAQAKGVDEGASTCSSGAKIATTARKNFPRRVRMSTSFPPFIHMFSTGRFRLARFRRRLAGCRAGAGAQRRRRGRRVAVSRFPARRHDARQLRRVRARRRSRRGVAAARRHRRRPPSCTCSAFRPIGGLGADRRLRRFGARGALRGDARSG